MPADADTHSGAGDSGQETPERTAFSSLKIQGYRYLWLAGTFSFMAVQMQFLLRGVLAWDLTEREGALGLVYLCFGISMLIATPLGGVAADRLPNRAVLLASQMVLFVGALGMGLAVVTDVVQFWMLLVAAVATGTAFGFYGPTRVAFSARLVGADQLGNAITLSMLSLNGTRVFAPSLAGVLAGIAFFGIGGAYLVSAAFSAVGFYFIARCPRGEVVTADDTRNPFQAIADGVRYVRRDAALRRLVVTSFVVIMFGFNYVAFIPALVKDVFELGDGWVGLIMSASAIGAVVVAASLAKRADGPDACRLMIISGAVFGVGVAALALSPNFAVAWIVVAVIGAGATGFQSLSNALALSIADEGHRGRVQSLMMLSFAGFGIAAGPLGLLAELIGLRWAIALMGGAATAAMLVYGVIERNRLDDLAAADADPAAPAVANARPIVGR